MYKETITTAGGKMDKTIACLLYTSRCVYETDIIIR